MFLSKHLLLVSLRACTTCQLYNGVESHMKRYLHCSKVSWIPTEFVARSSSTDVKPKDDNVLSVKTKMKESGNFSDDPDVFGTLCGPASAEIDFNTDEGDQRETEHLEEPVDRSYKLSTKQYADMIKNHLNNKDLIGAIEVLQERMLKQDRVKPENYIYNLLIGGCGRMGQAKQAFHLYNQMKKRGLKVTGGTYTALFNACATSFYPLDGLKRANQLRELIIEKGYQLNETNYHAMMKAFGRCGDTKTAFLLMDEMILRGFVPTDEAFNFLLQACVSEKEAGFRHALLVWRKMIDLRVKPTIYTYNLMLRAVRDCGLGSVEEATQILEKIAGQEQLLLETDKKSESKEVITNKHLEQTEVLAASTDVSREEIEADFNTKSVETYMPKYQAADLRENWPNLLAPEPRLGNVVALSGIVTPQDRLLLLGGCSAVLGQMYRDGVQPDIKTFTQLLEVIPGTIVAEKALMSAMKRVNLQGDISFFNMLIKKRAMRYDYEGSRRVLMMISRNRLVPNEMTFGVLAFGCKTEDQSKELLADMEAAGYRINIQILGALVRQACHTTNFGYVLKMMELLHRNNLTPNAQFYGHLQQFYTHCRQLVYDKENGLEGNFVNKDYFQKGFRLFSARYKEWLKQVQEKVPPSRSEQVKNQ